MATHTHTTSRRSLLSAVSPTALLLSGVAVAAPAAVNPDAELIGLCAEFEALHRKADAALAKDDAEQERADVITDAIYHEQAPIVAAITACRPTTPAGFTALANVAALANPMLIDGPPTWGDYSERALRVLLRGILGRVAA